MAAALALLKAIPWRWLALAGLVLAAMVAVQRHEAAVEQRGYERGARDVQAQWDRQKVADAQAAQLDLAKASQANSALQEQVHVIDHNAQQQAEAHRAALADAGAVAGRLREQLHAYLERPAPRAPDGAASACEPDGRAAALGQLLERADELAQRRTDDAERLADQVRGLQGYAQAVSEANAKLRKELEDSTP